MPVSDKVNKSVLYIYTWVVVLDIIAILEFLKQSYSKNTLYDIVGNTGKKLSW